ncbi:lysosome-associated membrane glycoprotein 1-like [Pocillopora damicornis]|uniref:lysosome-associated membrane glycoprotein 1-like n=1 Tax=Pocillopora damicornis TaxID=46731 RepID=UPI000F55442E|nr:lysosome-associated membrane glycoprotein 1-like [Pocillopora damicornis]
MIIRLGLIKNLFSAQKVSPSKAYFSFSGIQFGRQYFRKSCLHPFTTQFTSMAQRTACLFQLYPSVFVGLVIFYLTSEVTANSTSTMVSLSISPSKASTSTIASSTVDFSTMPPKTQSPASGYGHFNISGADGKPCLLLDISCAVTLQLQSEETFDLPLNAIPSGTCGEKTSFVSLAWKSESANMTISLTFLTVKDKWITTSLVFTYIKDISGSEWKVSAAQNNSEKLMMTAAKEKSFKCSESLDITLEGKSKVTVSIKKIKVQPFGSDFGEADVCSPTPGKSPAEHVDTIVPTIVGCVLAGLIVILIITYFVGRCKRTGYEKM